MLFAKLFGSPVWVFGGAIVAFGGWLAVDAAHPADASRAPEPRCGTPAAPPVEHRLCGVHPGVPREHIERLLAEFPYGEPEPSDLSAGTPERLQYRIELTRFVPHLMGRTTPHTFRPGPHLLTLVFDAGAPGQPLRRIELTPER
ncbi:MAG: hypothetical protein FJ304_16595 [Planctomycetes bacterium]|nr:hypothetical protein [Planctomycetota bacterium]